jgi:hypothetical protein
VTDRPGAAGEERKMRTLQPLFSGSSLHDHLTAERARARGAVDAIPADVLLDRTDEENIAALLEALRLEAITLHWDEQYSPGFRESKVDVQHDWRYGGSNEGRPVMVDATSVAVHVPYTGDSELLRLQPSRYNLNPPRANIDAGEIRWGITQPGLTPEHVASAFSGFQQAAQQAADNSRADVDAHNRALEDLLRQHISARRARLLQQRELAVALPFPIRPAGAAPTYALPVRRTKIQLTNPRPAAPFQPEPALEDAMYEDVLGRIVAWGNAVERTPASVGALDEEGLRDQLLVALNLAYEGQAAGEVFNRSGKTDITLRQGDKNAFIAECKIWRGAASVSKAVDQLLEYLVWRDSKAALILFIKNGTATDVIAKADAAIHDHAACQRRHAPTDPSRRTDYLLRSTSDPARSIRTALLPLVIGTPKS